MLKWEGIILDPLGAMLAVLVFEIIHAEAKYNTFLLILKNVSFTLFLGAFMGIISAIVFILLLRYFLIPDYLQNSVSLMLVIASFTASNSLQHESGLFTVTLMGMLLANQKYVTVREVIRFKEDLRVILISSLFIILTARLNFDVINELRIPELIFLIIVIVFIRPASVFISSIGSKLPKKEILFLSLMAPRGIVAAAISSVFSFRLHEAGFEKTDLLVSTTYLVITGTVIFYSFVSPYIAGKMGISSKNSEGTVIFGAHNWARKIANSLKKQGINVILVDSNRENIVSAKLEDGIDTYYGNIISREIHENIDLSNINRLIALSQNDEANTLAAMNFSNDFGSAEVYQLFPHENKAHSSEIITNDFSARFLFGEKISYSYLDQLFKEGAELKTTNFTDKYTYNDFQKQYNFKVFPLFVIDEDSKLRVITSDMKHLPQEGETLISIIKKH